MKRIYFLLSFALLMAVFTSCTSSGGSDADSGADTPEEAVENYINAAKDGDLKTLVSYCCNNDGEPWIYDELAEDSGIDEEEFDREIAKIEKRMKKEFLDVEFEIGDVRMNDDEDRATVTVVFKENGHVLDTRQFDCILCDDDKWRVREREIL